METEVPKWSTPTTSGRANKPKAAQQGRAIKPDVKYKGDPVVPAKTGRAATKIAGKGKPTKDGAKKTSEIAGFGKKPNVYLSSSDEEDEFVGSTVTPTKKLKTEQPDIDKSNNKQKQGLPSSSTPADPPRSESPPDGSQSSNGNFWGVSHQSKDAKSKPDTSQASQPSQSQSAVPPSSADSESKEKIGPEQSPESTTKDVHSEAASVEAKEIDDGDGDEEASDADEAGNAATPVRKAVNRKSLTASAARPVATPSTRGANIGGLTKGRLSGSNGGLKRILHPNATSDGSVGNVSITPTSITTKAYKPAGLSRSSRKSSAGVLPISPK